jgi:hypothetical protein
MAEILQKVAVIKHYQAGRFWSKVAGPTGQKGCRHWLGALDKRGYGRAQIITSFGKLRRAHRIAFFLATGIWPGGKGVCHTCDNPPCCKPKHLFLGTVADNNADMVAKGRQANGSMIGVHKLSGTDVAEIKRLYRSQRFLGIITQKDLARRFGVSINTIQYTLHTRGGK